MNDLVAFNHVCSCLLTHIEYVVVCAPSQIATSGRYPHLTRVLPSSGSVAQTPDSVHMPRARVPTSDRDPGTGDPGFRHPYPSSPSSASRHVPSHASPGVGQQEGDKSAPVSDILGSTKRISRNRGTPGPHKVARLHPHESPSDTSDRDFTNNSTHAVGEDGQNQETRHSQATHPPHTTSVRSGSARHNTSGAQLDISYLKACKTKRSVSGSVPQTPQSTRNPGVTVKKEEAEVSTQHAHRLSK